MERQAQKKESRFIEEPKVSKENLKQELITLMIQNYDVLTQIQTSDQRFDTRKRVRTQDIDLRPSESWRHDIESRSWEGNRDTEESGLRINETVQILDHKESDADIRESRSLPLKKRASILDWGSPIEYLDRPDVRSWPENMEKEVSGVKNLENMQQQQQQQQSLRDAETQRRSHETELRFLQHKNRAPDRGANERKFSLKTVLCKYFLRGACKHGSACRFIHPNDKDGAEPDVRILPMRQAKSPDCEASESNKKFDERSESEYPVRPGEKACSYYMKNGLCGFGIHCVLNHPRCKYFERGDCKNGSACQFIHSKNMDRSAKGSNLRFDERSYETESSTRPEKRAKTNQEFGERLENIEDEEIHREQEKNLQRNVKAPWILRLEKRYNRDFKSICDGIVEGYKQAKMEGR